MPNGPVPAAAPGLPAEPLISAIANYWKGMADFEAISEADWPQQGGHDAVADRTYGAPLHVLETWSSPVTTRAGLVAALQFALSETQGFWSTPSVGTMIKAALSYLEAEARLLELGAQMDAVEAENDTIPDDAPEHVSDANYEARWAVREKIETIAANTVPGLKVKARAVQYALKSDPLAECQCDGSFVTLAQSLAADLLNLETMKKGSTHV